MFSKSNSMRLLKKNYGFTLVELMVTVSMAAVVMGLAVPSFNAMLSNNRMVTQTNGFVKVLQYVRNEAVKRGTRITLCKSADGNNCSTDNAVSWQDGWLVFVDNGTTVGTLDAGEVQLRESTSPVIGIDFYAINFAHTISYLPSGMAANNSGPASGEFLLCDYRGESHARQIEIKTTGRIAVEIGAATGACTPAS